MELENRIEWLLRRATSKIKLNVLLAFYQIFAMISVYIAVKQAAKFYDDELWNEKVRDSIFSGEYSDESLKNKSEIYAALTVHDSYKFITNVFMTSFVVMPSLFNFFLAVCFCFNLEYLVAMLSYKTGAYLDGSKYRNLADQEQKKIEHFVSISKKSVIHQITGVLQYLIIVAMAVSAYFSPNLGSLFKASVCEIRQFTALQCQFLVETDYIYSFLRFAYLTIGFMVVYVIMWMAEDCAKDNMVQRKKIKIPAKIRIMKVGKEKSIDKKALIV